MNQIIVISKEKVKNGKLKESLELLITYCNDIIYEKGNNSIFYGKICSDLMLVSSRYSDVKRKNLENTITMEAYNLEYSKISKSILYHIGKLEKLIENKEDTSVELSNEDTDESIATQVRTETKNVEIELTINGDINTYSEADKRELLRAIGVLINLDTADIVIKKVRKGSIILTIEIPADKEEALLSLVNSGLLDNYNVKSGKKSSISFLKDDFDYIFRILIDGGIILFPTDTIWGIGCDATNPVAIERIYNLKKRARSKPFILLVSNIEMLKSFVEFVHSRIETLLSFHQRPLTVIYDRGKNLPFNAMSENGSVGIRIVKDAFCQQLIEKLGRPLIATSANISNESYPRTFGEISSNVISGVDYVVYHRRDEISQREPSTIVRCTAKGEIVFIRE